MKKRKTSSFLYILIIVLFIIALALEEKYLRGCIFIMISACLWIDMKIDPNTQIYSMSNTGFWSAESKKSIAIGFSVVVVFYWVVELFFV